jgi:hypothetical protein
MSMGAAWVRASRGLLLIVERRSTLRFVPGFLPAVIIATANGRRFDPSQKQTPYQK